MKKGEGEKPIGRPPLPQILPPFTLDGGDHRSERKGAAMRYLERVKTFEEEEDELLALADPHGIVMVGILNDNHQKALERIQARGWTTLLDVRPLVALGSVVYYRIFRLSAEALAWRDQYRQQV